MCININHIKICCLKKNNIPARARGSKSSYVYVYFLSLFCIKISIYSNLQIIFIQLHSAPTTVLDGGTDANTLNQNDPQNGTIWKKTKTIEKSKDQSCAKCPLCIH